MTTMAKNVLNVQSEYIKTTHVLNISPRRPLGPLIPFFPRLPRGPLFPVDPGGPGGPLTPIQLWNGHVFDALRDMINRRVSCCTSLIVNWIFGLTA